MMARQDAQWGISDRARRFHSEAVIWDDHAGFAPFPDLDLSFLDRWQVAGASYLSVDVGFDAMPWDLSLRCVAHFRRWLELHCDQFVLVERIADVRRAKQEGKMAVSFDLEGANALNENIEFISLYHRLGVRQILFAYNRNNAFGGGCMDVDVPLTPLGRDAVVEMNRVGVLIDCSHAGYTSSLETMELSEHPVIFSHSNPRALWDHPRNIRDEQMKVCARTGGVIAVNGVGKFLGENDTRTETIARHIRYVVDLVGVAHVGIGIDSVLDPIADFNRLVKDSPDAMNVFPGSTLREMTEHRYAQPEQLPHLTEELLSSGFSDHEVKAIMGENFMRVAEMVWG